MIILIISFPIPAIALILILVVVTSDGRIHLCVFCFCLLFPFLLALLHAPYFTHESFTNIYLLPLLLLLSFTPAQLFLQTIILLQHILIQFRQLCIRYFRWCSIELVFFIFPYYFTQYGCVILYYPTLLTLDYTEFLYQFIYLLVFFVNQ